MDRCRCCLMKLEESLLLSNDNNILVSLDLSEKLTSCCPFPVDHEEEYPKNVCPACLEKINTFYDFQEMCKASLKRFKEINKNADFCNFMFDDEKPEYDLGKVPKETNIVIDNFYIIDESKGKAKNLKRQKRTKTKELFLRKFKEKGKFNFPQSRNRENANPLADLNCDSGNEDIRTTFPQSTVEKDLDDQQHLNNNENGPFDCNKCHCRFFQKHRLVAHLRKHEGLKPYPCQHDKCSRTFSTYNGLKNHLKEHEGPVELHHCEVDGCDRAYRQKAALVMHLRKFHKRGPELKTHICEICGKVFKSTGVLKSHRFSHIEKSDLPHPCQKEGCQQRFSSKEKLKVHMMRHAGIKNFACPFCGLKKTTKNELNVHINYHTLERTWACQFCPKVCNSPGNLKLHVKTIHEKAKEFACQFCDKSFAKSDTRKYHEMTHTGEKPNECKECGKRFTQPAALRTHKKIHLKYKTIDIKILKSLSPPPPKEEKSCDSESEAAQYSQKASTDKIIPLDATTIKELLSIE